MKTSIATVSISGDLRELGESTARSGVPVGRAYASAKEGLPPFFTSCYLDE